MKTRVIKFACILLIVAGCAFIIFSLVMAYLFNGVIQPGFLKAIIFVVIAAGFWCLKSSSDGRGLTIIKNILLSVMGLLTIYSYITFISCIPKYTIRDAYAVVKAKPLFTSLEIQPSGAACGIDGNLLVDYGYMFYWYKDGLRVGTIYFDPITGEHSYTAHMDNFTIESECFESPDSEEFFFQLDNSVYIHLLFNRDEKEPLVDKYVANGKWEVKEYKGGWTSGYAYLDENDVKAFIKELGEQKFRDQLDKIVMMFRTNYGLKKQDFMPPFEELTMEVSLYGVEIATFKNGEIALK